jgi:ribokinase
VRVAVVGHLEWVEFAAVERVPLAGEIVHARESWGEPAGGGTVAAAQLARLAGSSSFYTALGEDDLAERSRERLSELGVRVHAERNGTVPTRRAFTFVDDRAERTITTLGMRAEPRGADALPWSELATSDAVYVTAGDAQALAYARTARVLVASPRAGDALATIAADALVYSAGDALEREAAARTAHAALIVATEGREGGSWRAADGTSGRWVAATPPGPPVDFYGAGDSFAAGLTFALGEGRRVADALAFAARCGAWCASGRGPYEGQLRSA